MARKGHKLWNTNNLLPTDARMLQNGQVSLITNWPVLQRHSVTLKQNGLGWLRKVLSKDKEPVWAAKSGTDLDLKQGS